MKIAFKNNVGLNKRNLEKLYGVNGIIEEYMKQGYRLTLRQLYYQLVSRNIIKNDVREYAKLSILLGKDVWPGLLIGVWYQRLCDRRIEIKKPCMKFLIN